MVDVEAYTKIRAATLAALSNEDYETAFRELRGAISREFDVMDGATSQFAEAFGMFADISEHVANEEFVALTRQVADEPNDVQGLFDLGYALYEESLFGIAATVLARANQLAPEEGPIVLEFVGSLEAAGLHYEAIEELQRHPAMLAEDSTFSFLLAFNGVMIGDLDLARKASAGLEERAQDENQQMMAHRMQSILRRADTVAGATPLDGQDLRGWHYVICASLVTTLSPYGYPDPMNGRYAFLNDSLSLVRVGLERLRMILELQATKPEYVYSLPDRDSQIVARAVAQLLDLPLVPWLEEGADPEGDGPESPGVIVAFDLSRWPLPNVASLHPRRPGQLLFSHSMDWTTDFPVVPDVVTLFCQTLTPAWAAETDVDSAAAEILSVEPIEEAVEDTTGDDQPVPPLSMEFLRAIGEFPDPEGGRERFWSNSPVSSNRFR